MLEDLEIVLKNIADPLKGTLEVLLLTVLIYSVLLFIRGSRTTPILIGITISTIILASFAKWLDLEVIDWLLRQLWALIAVSVLIIFQPELRRAFAELGSRRTKLLLTKKLEKRMVSILLDALMSMATKKIGALIILEKDIGMKVISDTGIYINGELTFELLVTFFYPNTPLHDGAVLIKGGKIISAGCFLPLTENRELHKNLGTRHRAAVGITEETDAVALIVSEESGTISIAHRGHLIRGLDRPRLERHLNNFILRKENSTKTMKTNIDKIKLAISEPHLDEDIDVSNSI